MQTELLACCAARTPGNAFQLTKSSTGQWLVPFKVNKVPENAGEKMQCEKNMGKALELEFPLNAITFLEKKDLFIYFEHQKYREKQRDRLRDLLSAGSIPDGQHRARSQELHLGLPYGSRRQVLGLSCYLLALFLGHLQGAGLRVE